MRESPQDFFLNTKARFQSSSDIEDAADLYFACHNLINHGMDFEWDDTLQKMEDLLKEQEVEVEPKLKDGPKAKPKSVPVAALPTTDAMKEPRGPPDPREGMGTDPYRRGSSTPTSKTEHRSLIPDSRPSGRFGAKKACHANGPNSPYNKMMDTYHENLKSNRYPLADEDNLPALRELISDRATHNDDATLPDEFALLNLFIENASKPLLYEHLQAYYNPKSQFFCGDRDKELDKHSQQIMDTHLPTENRNHEGVVHFGDADDKTTQAKLHSYMEDIGHLSPDVIGQQAKEMRFRLYDRRYHQWLRGYDERFPDSGFRDSQKRQLFLEHLALELDGVPEDRVWDVLYSGNGKVVKGGYLSIANSVRYDEMRDKSKQIGNYALEHELVMLPFDEMVDFMLVFHQMAAQQHSKDFVRENKETGERYDLPWASKYQTKCKDDEGNDIMHFGDVGSGEFVVPFSPRDIFTFGKQMRVVNKDSQANYWCSPQDVQHNDRQHIIREAGAAFHKRLFARMLREAHGYKRSMKGSRDVGRSLIYKFAKAYHGLGWNDNFDVPDIKLDSTADLYDALDELLQAGMSRDLYSKANFFLDREYYGYAAETKAFQNRRDGYLSILGPWIDALEGSELDEHDSTNKGEKALPSKRKTRPFYPHRTRHTTTGGLGKERQDPICIMSRRYPHEYIDLEPRHLELSDVRNIPKPTDKDFKAFIEGLGDELGPEFENALNDKELTIPQIRNNPEYPILSHYLNEIWPERGISESELQASRETMAADDKRPDDETSWQTLDVDGLLSLALIRHTGMLTDDQIDVPYGRKLRGSLRDIRFFASPPEIARGSLGSIPATRADWVSSLTVTPDESAVFIVREQDVAPINRLLRNDAELEEMTSEERKQYEAWEKAARERLDKYAPKVPEDVTSKVKVDPREPGNFIKYNNINHQGRVNFLSRMFYGGRRHSQNTSTNHPHEAGRMRLNHLQNDGADAATTGGDGHAPSRSGMVGASFTHRREGIKGVEQNLALLKSLHHKLRASLWGMGGTMPLHYENGVTVLEDPQPFLDMIHNLSKQGVPQHFLDHKSKFFEEGTLNNFFASLAAKRGKRSDQEYGIRPSWREAVTSGSFEDENRNVIRLPTHYYYPVIPSRGGYRLELAPGPDKGEEGRIYTPLNLLNEGATTPLRSSTRWENIDNVEGRRPTLLDVALFHGDNKYQPLVDVPGSPDIRGRETAEQWEEKYDQFTSYESVHIPDRCIVKRPDGTFAAIGPHPAAFAGLWSDHILAHPNKPGLEAPMREAQDDLLGYAQEMVNQEINSKSPQDYTRDDDILYRAGLNRGDLHQIIRDEVNLFASLQHSWPLVVANAAINEYGDSDLDLDEMVSKFEDEHLKIGPDYPNVVRGDDYGMMRETSRRRAIAHELREQGYHLIQGDRFDDGHRRRVLRNILTHVQGTDKEDEWMSVLGDAGFTIDEGGAAFEYNSASKYHHWSVTDATTFSKPLGQGEGEYNHPLRRISEEITTKDVTGHKILTNYLDRASPHPHISRIFEDTGGADDRLGERLEALETMHGIPKDLEDVTNSATNIEHIKEAGHHIEGKEPLDWWKEADRDSKSTGASHKEMKLRERGKYARLSASLKSYFKSQQRSPHGMSELVHDFGPLFKRPVTGGGSVMYAIARDLLTARDRHGNLAFPEHANTLRGWDDTLPIDEKFDMLGDFFHCRGKWANVVDKKDVTLRPTRTVLLGDSPASGTDDTVDLSRSKIPCHMFNPNILAHFGDGESLQLHPEIANQIARSPIDSTPRDVPEQQWPAWGTFESVPAGDANVSEILQSFDVLTDMDLIYKEDKEEGKPIPVKAMHRIFSLDDLDNFKGLSGDWVLSSWPKGERVMVSKKGKRVSAYNSENESVSLPSVVREGVRAAHKANFLVDCLWDGEILHLVDIIKAADEDLGNNATKDRVRHLRANFSATEEVLIPAPINTKRVDNEGLDRAVKDLFKEKGVKQVMLRDADSTYMRGESRHPKWLLMTKEHQLDVMVLDVGGACLLGIGPLLEDDAKRLGNRAVKHDDEYYMDVGTITKPGLEVGQCVTIKTSNVTAKGRDNLKVFTVRGPKYVKDSETNSTDSLQTLSLLSGEKNMDVPHNVRVSKGSVHIDLPAGHVVYDTEPYGHSFIIKAIDAPSPYLETLAESQRDYWEPVAAVLLRAEIETKKAKKANVVPEPPANHDKKPKKVLKPSERLLKDPELAKQLTTALETLESVLKEKITWTGPKGLGIDFATPVESPSGPTENTEGYNLPDHDPGHRQEKGGDCWCGAKKGEMCEQGMGHKTQDCPKFSSPKKEEDNKHVKIPIS